MLPKGPALSKWKFWHTIPFVTQERAALLGVELVEMDDLLALSDFISLHTPGQADGTPLLGKKQFDQMKSGVRIVNCARGSLIDDTALISSIARIKKLQEQLWMFITANRWISIAPSCKSNEIICTPHLGASTGEAQSQSSNLDVWADHWLS